MAQSGRRLVDQLRTLMDLSAVINSTLDASEIRHRAVEAAAELVDAERGSLLLLDRDTDDLCFEVALGDTGETLKEVRLLKGQGIAGWVVENETSVLIDDVQHDPRFFKGPDSTTSFVTRDMVCVPVVSRGRVVGALQAMNRRRGRFGEDDRDLMQALANQVAVAIENANLYQELKEAFYETAEVLADTIEKRDPYTGGHTRRVMDYAISIALELGMSESEVENVRLAAILHDIGKIAIPDHVLQKPDKLTDEEFEAMRRHSQTAAEILGKVHLLNAIIPAVRSHHERMDGRGYPDRLTGEDIPLAARVIAVADTFDAMTTDRPYRSALTREAAVEELRRCSGTQFDPTAAAALVAILERGPKSPLGS